MKLDDLNIELRRAAVHVAITQVDLARLRLSEPARPVQASAPGRRPTPGGQSQFGDTVARDLVNALIDLLNVQNDFLSVWVDHDVQELEPRFRVGHDGARWPRDSYRTRSAADDILDQVAGFGAVRGAERVRMMDAKTRR